MKILAVDYGASRTGLAVCDPTEFLTTPITPFIVTYTYICFSTRSSKARASPSTPSGMLPYR